jgi:DNA-binding NarL/FixJ family response regulator
MHPSSTRPRVLLADDSEPIIWAISRLLADKFDVVGHARDGAKAIKAAIQLKPDVIVMDIMMPKLDGIQATRRLKRMNSPTKIVVLSGLVDQDFVEAALAAGANGFVFKSRAAQDLPLAIQAAFAGRTFASTKS